MNERAITPAQTTALLKRLGGTRGGPLTDFIEEKIGSYLEPTRWGTPRGDPIGFPRVKCLATLLALTTHSQKDIARGIGLSYGVLRKWRSEAEFKQLIQQHRAELVERFFDYIKARYDEKTFSSATADYSMPYHTLDELLKEAPLYEERLVGDIVSKWEMLKSTGESTGTKQKSLFLTPWMAIPILALLRIRLQSPNADPQLLQAQFRIMDVAVTDSLRIFHASYIREKLAISLLQQVHENLQQLGAQEARKQE